ncbi:hypothetical protein QR680_019300 [Steinernema hermaphroditum]|uniref:SGNH domain-containing protein n=1 Tax=Steinernema hermaphroditum TaxID=289476 RepID=A0AA39LA82_9BILA|nr:hypothetical protein QR680_019300 [Steinernema hermaphroditum]
MVLAVGRWMLAHVDYHYAQIDSAVALAMVTNIRNQLEHRGYFDQAAVEVQYYVLVPFFFYLCYKRPLLGTVTVNVLTGTSFMFSWFAEGSLGFDFVFARIWQFQVGAISAQFTRNGNEPECSGYEKLPLVEEENTDEERVPSEDTSCIPTVHLLLSAFLFILLLPEIPLLTEKGVRIFATLLAGILFAIPSNLSFFSTRFFTFFGDISYVLYLVHWPAILFCRYYLDSLASPFSQSILAAAISLSLSILFYYFIERPLLGKPKESLIFTCFCYAVCGCFLLPALITVRSKDFRSPSVNESSYYWSKYTYYDSSWPESVRVENAIQMNEELFWYGWHMPPGCESFFWDCKLRGGHSNLSVLTIGNSYASRAFPGVYEVLKDRAGTLELQWMGVWEALDEIAFSVDCAHCEKILDYARHQEKDILFIINRYKYNFTDPIKGPLEEEALMIRAVQELERLSKTTKKIVLSGILYRFPDDGPTPMFKLQRWLHFNRNLSTIATYPYQTFMDQHSFTLTRMNYLLTKCPKCVYFDMQAPFCNAEKTECRLFDERNYLSFFNDRGHLSVAGVERVIPSLRVFMDSVIQSIE